MKPGKGDKRYSILITGKELSSLQELSGDMVEAFGLDRRIENYKGTRPIQFFAWDLDCLDDVIPMELRNEEPTPGVDRKALARLGERLLALRAGEE